MAYAEYPKAMVHPNYAPAVVERPSPGRPLLPGEAPQAAKAAVFPPVTVMNEDQEEYHKSLGYLSTGGDPAGHEPALPPGYEPQEYPKWVGDQLVNCAEEEAALAPGEETEPAEEEETDELAVEAMAESHSEEGSADVA